MGFGYNRRSITPIFHHPWRRHCKQLTASCHAGHVKRVLHLLPANARQLAIKRIAVILFGTALLAANVQAASPQQEANGCKLAEQDVIDFKPPLDEQLQESKHQCRLHGLQSSPGPPRCRFLLHRCDEDG